MAAETVISDTPPLWGCMNPLDYVGVTTQTLAKRLICMRLLPPGATDSEYPGFHQSIRYCIRDLPYTLETYRRGEYGRHHGGKLYWFPFGEQVKSPPAWESFPTVQRTYEDKDTLYKGINDAGRKKMSLARFSVYCVGDGVAEGWTRLERLKIGNALVVLDFLRATLPEYGQTLRPIGRTVRQADWRPSSSADVASGEGGGSHDVRAHSIVEQAGSGEAGSEVTNGLPSTEVPWSTSSQFTAHPRALPLMAPSLPLPPELVALSPYAGVLAPHEQGRPHKEVPVDATSGKRVEGAPPLEEEIHACTRVFPTLPACRGHISSHKQGKSKASEAATEAGTGRPEQQESQNAASREGEESREKGRRAEPVVEVQVSRADGPHHHPVRLLHSPENAAPPLEQPGALLPSKPPTQKRPLSRKPAPLSLLQKPGSGEPSNLDESTHSQPSALAATEDTCENCTGPGERKPQPTTSLPPILEALRLEPGSSAEGAQRQAACTRSEVLPPYSGVTAWAARSGLGCESKEVLRTSNARPRPKADWSQLYKKPKLNLHSSR